MSVNLYPTISAELNVMTSLILTVIRRSRENSYSISPSPQEFVLSLATARCVLVSFLPNELMDIFDLSLRSLSETVRPSEKYSNALNRDS